MNKVDPIMDYVKSIDNIISLFIDAYFTFDDGSRADYYIIGDLNIGMGPVHINDFYWTIDNMVCAIHNKIPEKILFRHYEESVKAYANKETFPNLYNYRKQYA